MDEHKIKYSGKFPVQIQYTNEYLKIGDDFVNGNVNMYNLEKPLDQCVRHAIINLYGDNWYNNEYTSEEDQDWLKNYFDEYKLMYGLDMFEMTQFEKDYIDWIYKY